MKRPAFQFYPADWRKDAALQSCSLEAQGLWVNILCIAHECDPYGHLVVNGNPMQAPQIARLVGLPAKECGALLQELETAGVFSRLENGCIYSRRMVKDERLRKIRAEAGRLGGNPDLLGRKVNQNLTTEDNQQDKQSLTPSSSSSSSTSLNSNSKAERSPKGSRLPTDFQPDFEFCKAERPELDPLKTFEGFRDYWIAASGSKGVKADWQATWRNWVRNQKPMNGANHAGSGKYNPIKASREALARELAKESLGDAVAPQVLPALPGEVH